MADLFMTLAMGASLGAAYKSTINKVKSDANIIVENLQQAKKQQAQIGQAVATQTQIATTQTKLKAARIEAGKLKQQYNQANTAGDKSAKELVKQYDNAKKRVEKLTQTLDKQQTSLRSIKSSLNQAGIDTNDLSSANEQLNATLKKQQALFDQQQQKVKTRGAAWASLGLEVGKVAAVSHALFSSVGSAITFESTMADVRKVVDFDSPQQFKQMGADIREMSQWLGISAEGIGAIVASGGQSGIARKDLLAFAETAGKMGIAFDLTAEQAGDMMAKWRSGLSLTQDQVF